MEKKLNSKNKVAIIGAGNVGSTFAFSLMISGLAREIVLIDIDKKRAEGESIDLSHGASFVSPVNVHSAGYEGCEGAQVVVITAGARQKPGETRLDLVQKNTNIFKEMIPQITKYAKDAILLIVTNPVDILTYVSLKISGLPSRKVIGSGTVLDSSRFRYLISKKCNIDPRNVHAYIVGEHGDSELPVWSNANIGGVLLKDYYKIFKKDSSFEKEMENIFKRTKEAAYKIIKAKGSTYYAIGLSLTRIVKAILRNENSVLPVSALIEDYYGINDVCLSIPSIVNKKGIHDFLKLNLSKSEEEKFKKSADTLKEIIKDINF